MLKVLKVSLKAVLKQLSNIKIMRLFWNLIMILENDICQLKTFLKLHYVFIPTIKSSKIVMK